MDNTEEEIGHRHDQAELFLSLFFAGIDFIIYISIITLFGCQFKNSFSHKIKLNLLIILDVILRIITLFTSSFTYSLQKEICITTFSTLQFILIINLLNQIYKDKNVSNSMDTGINNKFLCSILFCGFTIVLNFSKIISLVQYALAIISLIIFGYIVGSKNTLFLKGIFKKNPNFYGKNFTYNLPLFIGIYFFVHYVLKILGLFIDNPLYCSYMEMACDLFKEVGKYLTFVLVISVYYLYNKYVKDINFSFVNESSIQSTVNEQLPKEKEKLQE